MTDQLTQQDVNNTAWAACDTFRGVIDPAQYKDYILVMLFLKYISDQWADHYAEYKKEYGDNEERIRRKLERERFILPYVEFKDEKTGEVRRKVEGSDFDGKTYVRESTHRREGEGRPGQWREHAARKGHADRDTL